MKSHARVVVIGGGVVGVSALYHLAGKGWGDDAALVEKAELTSGSTWHAAGLLPLFNMSYSVGQIHKYSVNLYQELEAETGQQVGFKQVGNLRLAMNRDRMDEYYQYAATARTIGVHTEFLTPAEVGEIWPLCNTDGLVGALFHPGDGYIQPADLTQALAKGARARGAAIYRNTLVEGIERTASGEWRVKTSKGDITCEHVVSATGNYARRTGAMVGLDVPVMPVEHQYIVTEAHPDLTARAGQGAAGNGRPARIRRFLVPAGREPGLYPGTLRERRAMLLRRWTWRRRRVRVVPGGYRAPGAPYRGGHEAGAGLCRMRHQAGLQRRHCLYPDGNPIVGPAWGLRNFWLNEGHSFGITAAGGAGKQLAEWIVEGEPGIDMLGVEPRRFGDYVSKDYLVKKNEEAYSHVFIIHYPDEERAAARPLKTAPCYGRLLEKGAVFGQKFGWERANWFATDGMAQEDHWSFRRSRWFEAIRKEALHVNRAVGLLDMTPFAKCRVSGPGAAAFLDYVVANRLPAKTGRIRLCHSLNRNGGRPLGIHHHPRGGRLVLPGLGCRLAAAGPRLPRQVHAH